jgi:hypothetical protein
MNGKLLMTLWISGVLVNTSSGQSGTNKKSHKTCQLCPAIILTPSEAEGVGDGGGDIGLTNKAEGVWGMDFAGG